jgi:hypothetical protein
VSLLTMEDGVTEVIATRCGCSIQLQSAKCIIFLPVVTHTWVERILIAGLSTTCSSCIRRRRYSNVFQFFIVMRSRVECFAQGVDCSINKKAVQKLRKEAERVKRSLSTSHQETIEVDAFCDGSDLRETLSRAKFEELNMDLFKKTLGPVQKVVARDVSMECVV